MLVFLIMAGGSGERFWPLSTKEKPKQFLSLFSSKSLLRMTYERILPLADKSRIFFSTGLDQLKNLRREIPEAPIENIILEPERRDTTAAIGYGTLMISKVIKDPVIAVLPSDHRIEDEEGFRNTIKIAEKDAEKDRIVTLGMTPSYPETGYGYIEVGKAESGKPTKAISFREKPNYETACQYIESKKYLWNGGIFVFKSSTILEALQRYSPVNYGILRQIDAETAKNEGIKTVKLIKPLFSALEKKSIDFAVMEHADNIDVIPASFGWSDVGSYKSFEDIFPKNAEGDVTVNTPEISFDSSDNIIISQVKGPRVALVGIHNKVIVYTSHDILICEKERLQDIKKLLEKSK
jgi:mannose-1-phosphate guanylyltransferase